MENGSLRSWFVMWMLFACSAVLFVLATHAEAGHEDRDKDKYAVIDCWDNKFITLGEVKPDVNKVREGRKLKWDAYGPENTKVTITFWKDPNYPNCEGTSPDDDPNPKQEIIGSSEHEQMDVKVKTGKGLPDGKCYVYKVTCDDQIISEEKSAASALDPIIEVPKP